MPEKANFDPIVVVKDLHKTYKLGFARRRIFKALDGVSFSIRKGSIAGFLGPNGAGKTTTIKILTGLIFPTSGHVSILGSSPATAAMRHRLGYLPENPSFHDHLTGREALGFACDLLGVPKSFARSRVDEALAKVQLSKAADLQVRRYSKGMTQRLGIAQALVHDPELLILDEPMSGLDPIGRRDVKDLLRDLAAKGKTLFFSTHIVADVEDICDRVSMISQGRIVRDSAVQDLLGPGAHEMEVVATQVPAEYAPRARLMTTGIYCFTVADLDAAQNLVQELWQVKAKVLSMGVKRYRLEDFFLKELGKPAQPV
jgi:ABC-2 type transport system ATP-binding protein